MKTLATTAFRQPPLRLNCAQAVAHAWQIKSGRDGHWVGELAGCGGGGAPGGICGALHAAHLAIGKETLQEKATREFAALAGSVQCREIRRLGVATCAECVEQAAAWLEQNMDGRRLI